MDRNSAEFTAFVKEVEPRVRYALVAGYGPERGLEGTAEAFAFAWEHWGKLQSVKNPAGYIYRVGQRHAARMKATPTLFPEPSHNPEPWFEPGLPTALERLSAKQRAAVVLIRGFGYTHREVADLLGARIPTVQKHLDRGLAKLRSDMGVKLNA